MDSVAQVGVCNYCGKEFSEQELFSTDAAFSYDSKYDGDMLSLKLCTSCLDLVVKTIVNICAVSPVIEGYCGYDECEEDLESVDN